jgi:hypothetical protein
MRSRSHACRPSENRHRTESSAVRARIHDDSGCKVKMSRLCLRNVWQRNHGNPRTTVKEVMPAELTRLVENLRFGSTPRGCTCCKKAYSAYTLIHCQRRHRTAITLHPRRLSIASSPTRASARRRHVEGHIPALEEIPEAPDEHL